MKTDCFNSRIVRIAVLMMTVLAATSAECFAVWGWQDTWCAWKRTWHAPSAFDNPLNPYYVPRMSEFCDGNGHVGGCSGVIAEDGWPFSSIDGERLGEPYSYPAAEAHSSATVEFERLGKIPNDLNPGLGNSSAAPRRVGR